MNTHTARGTSASSDTDTGSDRHVRILRASSGQERMWLAAEADGTTAPYAVPIGYHVDTHLTAEQLAEAMRYLVGRHDALRTGLRWTGDGLTQEVHAGAGAGAACEAEAEAEVEARTEVKAEVRELSCAGVEEFADALAADAAEPFDLSRPPLVRALLAPLALDRTAFGFVFHHAVCDSWALDIFLRDLTAFLDGHPPEDFAGDHAAWSIRERQRTDGPEAQRDRAWWTERLRGGAPALRLGRGIGPGSGSGLGSSSHSGAMHRFTIPAHTIESLVKQTTATPFAIMLAGFGALLHRYSLNERISIGLPIAGRDTPDDERVLGYLSNTVVTIEDYPQDTTIRTAIASALEHVAEGLEHGGLPYQDVVALPGVRKDAGVPLYQVIFGWQSTHSTHDARVPLLAGKPLVQLPIHNGTSKCDLALLIGRAGDHYDCELEYDTALFDQPWAARLADAYCRLLQTAEQQPDTPVAELALLTPEQMAAMAAPRPDAADYRDRPPIHVSFEQQAVRTPDAVAVRWDEGHLTYRELDHRANALAYRLAAAGAGPGSRVGIRLGRGPELICAALGVLKAGAAFVPLDPRLPVSRVGVICADADVHTVIADAAQETEIRGVARVLVPDEAEHESPPDIQTQTRPGDLAYIYYTSGSTGTPKGVPLDHQCVSTRMAYLYDAYPLAPGEAVLHKTPLIFDVSIWEIFLPLFSGALIRVVGPGRETDGEHIRTLLRDEPVVLVHFVPSALEAYLATTETATHPQLRWVALSGEAVTASLLHRARAHFGVPVHGQYGQTETSEVTVWDGEDGQEGGQESQDGKDSQDGQGEHPANATLLGREVGAYSLVVVDDAAQPVPVDVPGELCVSAPGGLAQGYLNRPGQTAQRFVPHPGSPGERLYRTGDLARRLESGLLEYLGRADHQVKIDGCRVELGEVESVLADYPGVTGAVAAARTGPDGAIRLVAYLTADGRPSPEQLAEHVRRRLPWYMVPGAFVQLPQFPRTMSGKIAREALPEPGRDAFGLAVGAEPPDGPVEAEIASVWSAVLGVAGIGRHDDFFRAGGTSLGAVRVAGAVGRRYGIPLRVTEFTGAPTVAGLADAVRAGVERYVAGLDDEAMLELLGALRDHG